MPYTHKAAQLMHKCVGDDGQVMVKRLRQGMADKLKRSIRVPT